MTSIPVKPGPATPIRLHRIAISGHSHRVELFMSLLGLPYELVDVDLMGGAHKKPDFLAMNPFGQVPVIEDGNVTLADSNAILVYLTHRYAQDAGQWLPSEPVAAAQVQRWLSVAAGPLAFGPQPRGVIQLFKKPDSPDDAISRAHALFRVMEQQLADSGFLAGERATLADIANYSYVAHAPEGNVSLEGTQMCGPGWPVSKALPRFVPMVKKRCGAVCMTPQTFHEGERAVQERVGVGIREKLAEIGPRVIRDFMPEQHRTFFEQLPFVVVGSVDAQGQPWASVLAAPAGFVQSPDPQTLVLKALPLAGDPLQGTLVDGAQIGLLGMEPHTRRRNRMNGVVQDVGAEGFAVHVDQSFGNCPKYIQAREPVYLDGAQTTSITHNGHQLDAAARHMVENADTLFIATSYAGRETGPASGVDVSHRGGKPGFVRVDGDATLTMPDFFGNFFFNTLGNIAVNPRAGLLFIDFDSGDLLYLAVRAEIIWNGPELHAFEGAQRLLRCHVTAMRRVEASLPMGWGPASISPHLAATGQWPECD